MKGAILVPHHLWRALVALLAAALFATPAWAAKYASIVVDMESAQVLHARNADELRHPASLTKVMTLYLTFDALDSGKLKLSDRLPVSKAASRQPPSKLGLKAGSTIKVEDAIKALVTKSANDVAVVLAEKLGGTEKKFAIKMNDKARELGLESTTFYNASGLPDARQVTTARDMARLAEAILVDHKDRYRYFATPRFTYGKATYKNHNTLLQSVEGVDGIKTGYTNASGYNLMSSAERNGRRVIAVMLGGATSRSRDAHVADLIEAAFLQLEGSDMSAETELMARLSSWGSNSWGENAGYVSVADDLAAAQLRRFQSDTVVTPDGGVAPSQNAPVAAGTFQASAPASFAETAFAEDASTEEGEEGFVEISEGDASEADTAEPAAPLPAVQDFALPDPAARPLVAPSFGPPAPAPATTSTAAAPAQPLVVKPQRGAPIEFRGSTPAGAAQ
jgi:D-alanyl-D-alanine carboxypeptidase